MSNLSENLQFALRCNGSYTESMFQHEHRFSNLIFDDSGKMKLGAIIGFISGLYYSGNVAKAEEFAEEFFKMLGYLATTSDLEVEYNGHKTKIPSTVIRLLDDGTAFGFNVGWYRYIDQESYKELSKDQINMCIENGYIGYHRCKYIFFMNGGFIFHGWNMERTGLREDLKDCFGVHT